MGLFRPRRTQMVSAERALAGRAEPMAITAPHLALGTPITPPFPTDTERAVFGMGCFWGAERLFWGLPGIHATAVGYAGGLTPNPTYREVCTGRTGHAEAVLVVFDPGVISYERLVGVFFEGHDPTQGMRQGNDVGTQYRSAIYTTTPEQADVASALAELFQERLTASGLGTITTQIEPAKEFFYAEPSHQQYLEANPWGYCGLGGTGVSCPIGSSDGATSDGATSDG